jgi:hypothetical protein
MFPEDTDAITGGLDPILPTPEPTPGPIGPGPAYRPAEPKKTRKPRDTTQGIQESNILEGGRSRKPTEKARKQLYLATLCSPENLQACYTAFRDGGLYRPGKIHRDVLPEPPET